jgi:hypothetical protein
MTQVPYAVPVPPPAERVRIAYNSRAASDYEFSFWTAFGWTFLTCGIFGIYVTYQLVRRMRDHNRRRLEELDAATTFVWERAQARGVSEELRPNFERIAAHMNVLRQQTTEFREPIVWALLTLITGVVTLLLYYFLDGDLIKHDQAEGAIEAELAVIIARLGFSMPQPDPARVKGPHNYLGRIVATIASCGIYSFWWLADLMREGNQHFHHNWEWEDALAGAVQSLATSA